MSQKGAADAQSTKGAFECFVSVFQCCNVRLVRLNRQNVCMHASPKPIHNHVRCSQTRHICTLLQQAHFIDRNTCLGSLAQHTVHACCVFGTPQINNHVASSQSKTRRVPSALQGGIFTCMVLMPHSAASCLLKPLKGCITVHFSRPSQVTERRTLSSFLHATVLVASTDEVSASPGRGHLRRGARP